MPALIVISLQVRAARGSHTAAGIVRAQRLACLAMMASCLVFGSSGPAGRAMAIVLQDVFLFSGDIASNITLGNELIGHDRMKAAARVVGAALCSEPVKDAFRRKLGPALEKRFGALHVTRAVSLAFVPVGVVALWFVCGCIVLVVAVRWPKLRQTHLGA